MEQEMALMRRKIDEIGANMQTLHVLALALFERSTNKQAVIERTKELCEQWSKDAAPTISSERIVDFQARAAILLRTLASVHLQSG